MELLVLDQQNRPAEATAPLFYRQLNRQPLFIMAAARVSISIWNSTILLNTPMLLPKLWTFPVLVLSQRSKLQVLPVLVVVLMPLMPLVMVLVSVVEVVVGKLVLLLMLHGPLSIDLAHCAFL